MKDVAEGTNSILEVGWRQRLEYIWRIIEDVTSKCTEMKRFAQDGGKEGVQRS